MTENAARLAYANIFASDHSALALFYQRVFGFVEIAANRSPIFVCLDAGGIELGFNAEQAYGLMGLGDRKPRSVAALRTFLTIEVSTPDAIDKAVTAALENGGNLVKAAYDTYYNARTAIVEDPEGNVFRINHRKGPRIPADELDNPPWEQD
jgi:predicted enzyme related to lactoylglutathione lyase